MSFILDALRKSDSEHQQQRSPEYVAPPRAGQRRSVPAWLWVFAALLAVNAVLIGVMMLRGGGTPPVEPVLPAAAALPVPATSGTATPTDETGRDDAPPPKAPVRSLLEETIREAREARAIEPPVTDSPSPAIADDTPQLAAPTTASAERAALDLRTLDELRARGDISIGDLHVDLHVYSADRNGRFVFVNGKRYNEGQRLAEGPRIVEITGFGAILEYDQRRFLLPRD